MSRVYADGAGARQKAACELLRRHLSRLLQVGAEVFSADAGQVEGGHDVRLGEVQAPRLGEEVRLSLGQPGVVQGRGEVHFRVIHSPAVLVSYNRRPVTESTALGCTEHDSFTITVQRRYFSLK